MLFNQTCINEGLLKDMCGVLIYVCRETFDEYYYHSTYLQFLQARELFVLQK